MRYLIAVLLLTGCALTHETSEEYSNATMVNACIAREVSELKEIGKLAEVRGEESAKKIAAPCLNLYNVTALSEKEKAAKYTAILIGKYQNSNN